MNFFNTSPSALSLSFVFFFLFSITWLSNSDSTAYYFFLSLLLASNSQHYLVTKSWTLHFSFCESHLVNILSSQHKSSQNWQLQHHHHVQTLLMCYLLAGTDSKHRSAATAEIIYFYILSQHITVSCFIHWWQWVHWHSIQTRIYYHFVRRVELSNISWDTHLNLQSFSSESVFSAWEVKYNSKLLTTWYSQCAKQYVNYVMQKKLWWVYIDDTMFQAVWEDTVKKTQKHQTQQDKI